MGKDVDEASFSIFYFFELYVKIAKTYRKIGQNSKSGPILPGGKPIVEQDRFSEMIIPCISVYTIIKNEKGV